MEQRPGWGEHVEHPPAESETCSPLSTMTELARMLMVYTVLSCRRKFRSQTSDNMERWKSRGGKSQGGEEKK